MGKSLTNDKVRRDMQRLYKEGWTPEEIILAFKSTHKRDEQVEKFVMRSIKPFFS